MMRRLVMVLAALLSVIALWGFYALLIYGVISMLPDSASVASTLPWWAAGLAAAWVGGFSLIYPRVLDGILQPRWIPFQEAGDVGPMVLDVLAKHGIPPPRLGVVMEDDPLVVTYGMSRSRARMVVSTGLLKALDVDGQSAVLCREVGHLMHGDFGAVTALATPVALFGRLVEALVRGRQAFGASSGGSGILVAPIVEVLASVHVLILAPLGRLRAVAADDFAVRALEGATPRGGRPPRQVLADALARVAYGLAQPRSAKRKAGWQTAQALRGFTPVDALRAARVATWSAWDGHSTAEDFSSAVERLGGNPFAGRSSWGSFHPRDPSQLGSGTAPARGQATSVALQRHGQVRLLHVLPPLGFLAGLGLSVLLHGYVGLPLVGWGLGRLAFVGGEFIRYRRVAAREEVEAMLGAAEPPWGESLRVDLEGTLCGLGIPGVTRSPDPVMRLGGMFLPLRLRLPFGTMQAFPQQQRLTQVFGEKVRVVGLLRFRDVPYLELHRLVHKRETWYSSAFVPVHVFISLLLAFFGVLLILPQWLGV